MYPPSKRHNDSFVVRLWREKERDRRWRASVTHLATGEHRYFTHYDDLLEFLDRWANPEGA
jgi:hypothetical protein